MEITKFCRHYLHEELEARKKKNAAYSLRSFAYSLGVSPGYISLVFKGQRKLSINKARSLTRKIRWNSSFKKYFLLLAAFESSQNEGEKSQLLSELEKNQYLIDEAPSLDVERFTVISQWHHTAILTLLTLPDFSATTTAIARRLNIPLEDARNALERMEKLGLVEQQKDSWAPTTTHLLVKPDTPSEVIRQYHKEYILKSISALEEQAFAERDFTTFVMALDPSVLPEAKQRIKDFQTEMLHLLEGKTPSRVYQLSIQLARVDRE